MEDESDMHDDLVDYVLELCIDPSSAAAKDENILFKSLYAVKKYVTMRIYIYL